MRAIINAYWRIEEIPHDVSDPATGSQDIRDDHVLHNALGRVTVLVILLNYLSYAKYQRAPTVSSLVLACNSHVSYDLTGGTISRRNGARIIAAYGTRRPYSP